MRKNVKGKGEMRKMDKREITKKDRGTYIPVTPLILNHKKVMPILIVPEIAMSRLFWAFQAYHMYVYFYTGD